MTRLKGFSVSIFAAALLGCSEDGPEPFPAPHYIASFGTWGTDEGEFEWPRAIAVGPDRLLYVGDTGNERVVVFTQDGEFVRQWSTAGPASMIALGPDSSVYVDLYDRSRLRGGRGFAQYTRDGQLISVLGFVNAASGFEVDASGNLYICGFRIYGPDPFHPFVEGPYFWKFNPQQELIKKWGYPGPTDTTGWSGGRMTWNTKGNLLVLAEVDSITTVIEFTPDGDRVSSFQIPTLTAYLLEDIACDRSDRILISSPQKTLVHILDSRGRLLTEFNELNEEEEPLSFPTGIAVDLSGFLYVVDFFRYRVVKYQLSP